MNSSSSSQLRNRIALLFLLVCVFFAGSTKGGWVLYEPPYPEGTGPLDYPTEADKLALYPGNFIDLLNSISATYARWCGNFAMICNDCGCPTVRSTDGDGFPDEWVTAGSEGRQCNNVGKCGNDAFAGQSGNPTLPQPPSGSSGTLAEMQSSNLSTVNNQRFEYVHIAKDYSPRVPGGVSLTRVHQPRALALRSSFGAGVFSQYDYDLKVEISPGASVSASLFEPTLYKFHTCFGSDATLHSVDSGAKAVKLFDQEMVLVENPAYYPEPIKFAQVEFRDGTAMLFELILDTTSYYYSSGQRRGRVVEITKGANKTTISYKPFSATELNESFDRYPALFTERILAVETIA